MADNDNKALGKRIRDMINPALEDERRKQMQLEILDGIFQRMAGRIGDKLEESYTMLFNQAAQMSRGDEKKKNAFLIQQLTTSYAPIVSAQLPVLTNFTDFQPMEIRELPGWIALHEKARDMDVAVRLTGLTVDESKAGNGGSMPVVLTLDATKSYNDGATESSLYPTLPEQPVEFDTKSKGRFNFSRKL